jgi:hypothetical protein
MLFSDGFQSEKSIIHSYNFLSQFIILIQISFCCSVVCPSTVYDIAVVAGLAVIRETGILKQLLFKGAAFNSHWLIPDVVFGFKHLTPVIVTHCCNGVLTGTIKQVGAGAGEENINVPTRCKHSRYPHCQRFV